MKKLITLYCCCICLNGTAQEAFYNNGSIVQINGNAILQVNGNMVNNTGSNYINDGIVRLQGNFTNHQYLTAPFNGAIIFEGNTTQSITGTVALFAKNVRVQNGNGVNILDTLKVDGVFSFVSGIINAADKTNPVLFTINGSVSEQKTPSDASHVNGYAVRQGLGNFSFPVGDGSSYQPVAINTTTNSNGFLVNYHPNDAGTATFTNTGTETSALVSYNKNEYWDIVPWNSGTATGTVSILWDGYNDVFDNPLSQRKVAHKVNSYWLNEGTTATGSQLEGEVTSNLISTWGRFALGTINTPLPLQLISFSGNRSNNINRLKWRLSNPAALRLIVLEKSSNGKDFYTISSLYPNSNQNHQFDDMGPQTGDSYYRLQLITKDGKISISNIVVLGRSTTMASTIYPNPVKSSTTLRLTDSKLLNSTAILIDATGKYISSILISNYFQTINMNHLPAGNYLLQLKNKEVVNIIKE